MTKAATFFWRVISISLLLAFFWLPIYLMLIGASWGWAFLAALSFWPSTAAVIWDTYKTRKWPVITGGPGINFAGKKYPRSNL